MSTAKIPVFSVIAWSGTGKTTYLEKLVPALRKRQLKVAVVKHDGHDFEIDRANADTGHFTRAGADISAIISSTHSAVFYNRPQTPEEFVAQITGVDVILTEGFKNGEWPKILIYRKESNNDPAIDPDACFAVITDTYLKTKTPQFDLNDPGTFSLYLYNLINAQNMIEQRIYNP